MKDIREVTIVTAQGVKVYYVGQAIDSLIVQKIEQQSLYFTGDPYDHYVGIAVGGDILFSINCLVPCVVEYDLKNK